MKRTAIVFLATGILATLTGCPNGGVSPEDLLKLNDTIDPVVAIQSHGDGMTAARIDDLPLGPVRRGPDPLKRRIQMPQSLGLKVDGLHQAALACGAPSWLQK